MHEVDKLPLLIFLLPQVELEVWPLRHAATPPHVPQQTLTPKEVKLNPPVLQHVFFQDKRHLLYENE